MPIPEEKSISTKPETSSNKPKPSAKEKSGKFEIPVISNERLESIFSPEEKKEIVEMSPTLKVQKIPRKTVIDKLLFGSVGSDHINFEKDSLKARDIRRIFRIEKLGKRMTKDETVQFLNTYTWSIWNYFYPNNKMQLLERMDEVVAETKEDSVNLIYLLIKCFEKEGLKDVGLIFSKK